jgi:hypothetical protein
VDVIVSSFRKEDVERSSFYDSIQVNDLVGLVKGSQIPVVVGSDDSLKITDRKNVVTKYAIVGFDKDAADAVYLFLLRAS